MSTAFVPRHSTEAEESLLGSALYSRAAAEALVMNLRPEDFYIPANQRVAAAIIELQTNGIQIDVMTVHSELQRKGERASAAELVHVMANADATASHAESYIAIIRRESNARELDRAAREIQAELANGIDPAKAADSLEERLHALDRGSRLPENYWRDAGDYVAADHVEVGVPLFENGCYQHTRIIVLASEKAGKSMMLRQMAYCLAAGLHPWTFAKIEPVRVLLADCENDGDELIPTMRRLDALIAKYVGDGAARPSLFSAPYGLDLRSRRDRGEFESVLEDCRPQLIIGGPVYKIMPRREREDVDTHALAFGHLFDSFRKRWGCALMIEHHAPTGRQGETRELRSKGGQQWAAWPEVTVSLTAKTTPDGLAYFQVGFPHPTRGKFRWPKRFDRGEDHDWPWVPVLRAADVKKPDPPSVPRSFYEIDREESF